VTFLFSFTSIQQFKSPSLESVDVQKIYLRNDAGQEFQAVKKKYFWRHFFSFFFFVS